jgi:hypothetical protein
MSTMGMVPDHVLTPADIRAIADPGDPLTDPAPVLVNRVRTISAGYSRLSAALARLIAGPDGRLDANWCTFATWTTRTMVGWFERLEAGPGKSRRHGVARYGVAVLTHLMASRCDGISYRILAVGNRIVFREIGLVVAMFLREFADRPDRLDEARWTAFAAQLDAVRDEIAGLGAEWLLTDPGDESLLERGLRCFYEAMVTPDQQERAELVLAGTLLLGAHEQARVDGYITVCLSLFPRQSVRSLKERGDGHVPGRVRGWATARYAQAMSRTLYLRVPEERLPVTRPIPPPAGTEVSAPPAAVRVAALHEVLRLFAAPNTGARDWRSYEQRMAVIVELLRTRWQSPALFADPFATVTSVRKAAPGSAATSFD